MPSLPKAHEMNYLSERGTGTRKYGSETYMPNGTYGTVEIDVTKNSEKWKKCLMTKKKTTNSPFTLKPFFGDELHVVTCVHKNFRPCVMLGLDIFLKVTSD